MKNILKSRAAVFCVLINSFFLHTAVYAQDGTTRTVDNSNFVSQSVPGNMVTGETYKVIVTFMNVGTTTWKPDEYKLRIESGPEASAVNVWGVSDVNLSYNVEPGKTVSFELKVTAPSTDGAYQFVSKMMHGDYYFGQSNERTDVTVGPKVNIQETVNSGAFVEQTVPKLMKMGSTHKVSITFTNTGKTAWTPGKYRLVNLDSKGDALNNKLWDVESVELTETIAPGATKVFIFKVTAPHEKGNYLFQWRMSSSDGGLFGDATNAVDVVVQ
jgi:hypothetical protein